MDIEYYMKIQNTYGVNSRREKELVKTNLQLKKHYEDTYDTDDVLINGKPRKLMVIKDSDGNTFKKKIKSCHDDKFNLGDYVIWNNQYWIIVLIDPDDKTWNRGYMYLCTLPLRWQNKTGEIIERWCYSEDFTKYSNGTTGNSTITVGDNQYGLIIPIDEETKQLKRDMRFAIDFEDSIEPDIYALTNRKTQLNNNCYFGRGGTMILTMSFDSFSVDDDKLVTLNDGTQVWICNYHSTISDQPVPPTSDETTDLFATISCKGSKLIVAGGNAKTFSAIFTDNAGDVINNVDYTWDVSIYDEFKNCLVTTITSDNKCKIKILYNDLIVGNYVKISLKDLDGNAICSELIEIGGGL